MYETAISFADGGREILTSAVGLYTILTDLVANHLQQGMRRMVEKR